RSRKRQRAVRSGKVNVDNAIQARSGNGLARAISRTTSFGEMSCSDHQSRRMEMTTPMGPVHRKRPLLRLGGEAELDEIEDFLEQFLDRPGIGRWFIHRGPCLGPQTQRPSERIVPGIA